MRVRRSGAKVGYATWTIRRRAYPLLLLRLTILYFRSASFRAIVRLSYRHRRCINWGLVRSCIRAYLFATNARITIAGRVM